MASIKQFILFHGSADRSEVCMCLRLCYLYVFHSRRQSPGGGGDQERQFRVKHEAHQATAQAAGKRRDSVCGGLPWLPAEVCSDARPTIQEG